MFYKNYLNYFFIFIFFIVLGFAINTVATGYKINDNTNTYITAHSVCQKVTNNNCAGSGVFVPTKTATEWSNFRSNKPSCVALAACCTPQRASFNRGGCLSGNHDQWCEERYGAGWIAESASPSCVGDRNSGCYSCANGQGVAWEGRVDCIKEC